MNHLTFKELEWPARMNLGILAEVLSEAELAKLILDNMNEPRLKRRIVLPSVACVKRIQGHAIWKKILAGELDWEKYKKDLRKEHGSMLMIEISKEQIKAYYESREREILRDQK